MPNVFFLRTLLPVVITLSIFGCASNRHLTFTPEAWVREMPTWFSIHPETITIHALVATPEGLAKARRWEMQAKEIPGADTYVIAKLDTIPNALSSRIEKYRLVTALGVLGTDRAVESLTKVLCDTKADGYVVERAVWGLSRIGDARVVSAMETVRQSTDALISKRALRILDKIAETRQGQTEKIDSAEKP